MSTRQVRKLLRGVAAATVTVTMAFTLTACGEGEDKEPDTASSSSEKDEGQEIPEEGSEDDKVIATVKGSGGINIIVNSAVRDAAGFVTVKGKVENTSDQRYTFDGWATGDQDFTGKGASVGGMTLVDKEGKKRYYILRDTDNNCLCTMFSGGVQAKTTADFFAQFPAPPKNTVEVDLQVPTMSSATIQLTDK